MVHVKLVVVILFAIVLFERLTVDAFDDDDDEHEHEHDHDHGDDQLDEDYSFVTCGSAIKLVHKASGYRLHSHNIKWGSGSMQQSVTAFPTAGDPNSLWQIQSAYVSANNNDNNNNENESINSCPTGTKVACGQQIKLYHVLTRSWLHSHLHRSPLSGRQEISAYGAEDHKSDTGDRWIVECPTQTITQTLSRNRVSQSPPVVQLQHWKANEPVSLLHVDTGKRLYARRSDAFDNNNCRGCPIIGQIEVSGHDVNADDVNALWQPEDGFYFPVSAN